MSHLHWDFTAWNNDQVLTNNQVAHMVSIRIIGYENETMAEMAAKEIIKRDNYHLRSVWECNTCSYQEKNTKILERLTDKL